MYYFRLFDRVKVADLVRHLGTGPAAKLISAALLCAVVAGCTAKAAARRAFYAACADDTDCASGLCYFGACSKPCKGASECGAGICIESKCKPIERVACKDDLSCQMEAPDNGCRVTTCKAGACVSATVTAATWCAVACESGGAQPGTCALGHCTATLGAAVVACADTNACTEDACSVAKGCTHSPLDAGATCDDANPCTGADTCQAGGCVGVAKACDGGVCTLAFCNAVSGACDSTPATGKPCDDATACTQGDACGPTGFCSGIVITCADNNQCNTASCDAKIGCVIAAESGKGCDDGNPCTGADLCQQGVCAGLATVCDDGNPCTSDKCDAKLGDCVQLALPPATACDDGNACTVSDICGGGTCTGGLKACSDGNPCTTDGCSNGACQFTGVGDGLGCDDGDPCTVGEICNQGKCFQGKAKCDDGNTCTLDACSGDGSCTNGPDPQSAACGALGNCTGSGACEGAVCKLTGVCDDGNACTADSCDKTKGCLHVAQAGVCTDGIVCTGQDSCSDGACKGVAGPCTDDNVCTKDTCDPAVGCVGTPTPAVACNDGNACSGPDSCSAKGQCKGKATMWINQFGIGGQSEGRGVAVVGTVAVTAISHSISGKDFKIRVLGSDLDGPSQWDKFIDGPGDDVAHGVAAVGNLAVVVGASSNKPGAASDGLVAAFDADGNKVWQLTVGLAESEVFQGVAAASDTNAVAVGHRDTTGVRQPYLITVDLDGKPGLQLTYTIGVKATARAVVGVGDGYLLVGEAAQADGTSRGFGLRVGATGTPVWEQSYGAQLVNSDLTAVAVNANGFVFAGTTATATSKPQMWWVQVDSAGKVTSQFQYAQSVNAKTTGMVVIQGGYMLVGYATLSGLHGEDLFGLRVDTFGNYLYHRTELLTGTQRVYAAAALPNGGAMVAGLAPGAIGETDALVARANPWGIFFCDSAGQCETKLLKDCDDGNPCTADNCVNNQGCTSATLSDGAQCAGGLCAIGACK